MAQTDTPAELRRFRLDGRVAVVAGASGAIGARAAAALSGMGARVVAAGRSEERLEKTVAALRAAGGEATAVVADVAVREQADAAIQAALDSYGRIDVLFNAVGGGAGTALYPAESYPETEWDRIVDLNLRTTLLPSQAAARAMIAGGRGGRILNVSSVRGQIGIRAGYSAYVAAKGALNALVRQHATEWAAHRITVNAIAPTFVRTPQVASMLADRAFYEGLVGRIPLGRIAETDDLVGAILFFCSDASSFVTGQVLTLDGGLTATQ